MTGLDEAKKSSVKAILQSFQEGEESDYHRLLLKLRSSKLENEVLLNLLNQLQDAAILITSQCESLVVTILHLQWAHYDAELQQEYMKLLVKLASAQPTYLHHIVQMLASSFSPETILKQSQGSEILMKANSWLELRYAAIHSTIQALMNAIPITPEHLFKALRNHLPQISAQHEIQEAYIKNLFHVTRYLPNLRKDILEIVVNRITEIDVHCPQSDIWVSSDEEEDVDEEMEQTQFDMDDVSAQGEMDASKNETETTIPEGPRLSEIAVALDRLMFAILTFCKETFYDDGDINHQNATSLLLQLLQVFGRIVLPTHSSHHVQYCLFYMASLKKSFADAFLDYLWKQFVNPNTGSMIRQSSASYMASFLSRANFISLGIITASLELMAKWVHSYIDNQELSSQVKQDVNIHRPFYTLCQAMFYVIVYHYKDLLGSEKGNKFVMSLNLDRIISCKLNPLSYCLPSIVNIFATITRKYQVVFCYTIIERNARVCNVAQYQSSGFKKLIDLNNPLDTFFPFDPYLLPKSGEFIDSLYKQWEGTDLQQKSQSTQPEDEEDEFRIYEAHLQEVPLGLMPSSLSAVSPGFMSP
ncbi:RNA polymerase I-specific transcription initiation factor RRN3-like [Apostichopus japonicus]|uniref:RNA polymerase I-specific transcription initiation factor RRN3-like n=1 Tax=Stichopus japonicus TaxID=307972 RepID=UPI003AB66558